MLDMDIIQWFHAWAERTEYHSCNTVSPGGLLALWRVAPADTAVGSQLYNSLRSGQPGETHTIDIPARSDAVPGDAKEWRLS